MPNPEKGNAGSEQPKKREMPPPPVPPEILRTRQEQARKLAENAAIEKTTAIRQAQVIKQSIPENKAEAREAFVEKIIQESGIYATFWTPDSKKRDLKGIEKGNAGKGYNDFSEKAKVTLRPPFGKMTQQLEAKTGDLTFRRGILEDHQVNEIIDIRSCEMPVYKTEVTPGKKGFLGFGATPEKRERKVVGMQPATHEQLVAGGKPEDAVQFSYLVANKQNYRDTSRPGKALYATFVLPKSTALELEQQLNEDPTIMRDVVESAVKGKFLKDTSLWENGAEGSSPLRPPYEEWDSEPDGGRVYIQKEDKKPGWREEWVHNVKK